jgi:hypothetical protein
MLTLSAVCDLQNAGFRARSAEYRAAAPAEYRPGRSLGTCAPKRVGSSPSGQLHYGRYGVCSGSRSARGGADDLAEVLLIEQRRDGSLVQRRLFPGQAAGNDRLDLPPQSCGLACGFCGRCSAILELCCRHGDNQIPRSGEAAMRAPISCPQDGRATRPRVRAGRRASQASRRRPNPRSLNRMPGRDEVPLPFPSPRE